MEYCFILAQFFKRFPCPIVILDLETTGGDLVNDKITEIAYLFFQNGQVSRVHSLVNPQRDISPFVAQLTGIHQSMVADAPTFSELIPKLLPQLRGSLIIAHNSYFDYSFLKNECWRSNISFAAMTLCSVQLSRKLYPKLLKHSLDSIIERYRLPVSNRHRAMSDVMILTQYLYHLLIEFGEDKWQKVAQSLVQPILFNQSLPSSLHQQINQLPDFPGITIWYNHQQQITAVYCHSNIYREVLAKLNQQTHLIATTAVIDYQKSMGILHMNKLFAEALVQNDLKQLESQQTTGYYFIDIQPDSSGCLKAYIQPLKSGFYQYAPNGLFLYPKTAKKALIKWAQENQICPTQLGLLTDTSNQTYFCSVAEVKGCVDACQNQNTNLHNQNVIAALADLPGLYGKGFITVAEEEILTKQQQIITTCYGAIQLSNGEWYTNQSILENLKSRFKKKKLKSVAD